MGEAWFTGFPDELARCLVDARNCAEVCEAHLEHGDGRRDALDVLAAPAAVARVLIELIDHPSPLLLAAVRLCRELTSAAAEELAEQGPPAVVDALRAAARSAERLLDAAR